jgi:hypothetical protein
MAYLLFGNAEDFSTAWGAIFNWFSLVTRPVFCTLLCGGETLQGNQYINLVMHQLLLLALYGRLASPIPQIIAHILSFIFHSEFLNASDIFRGTCLLEKKRGKF